MFCFLFGVLFGGIESCVNREQHNFQYSMCWNYLFFITVIQKNYKACSITYIRTYFVTSSIFSSQSWKGLLIDEDPSTETLPV